MRAAEEHAPYKFTQKIPQMVSKVLECSCQVEITLYITMYCNKHKFISIILEIF